MRTLSTGQNQSRTITKGRLEPCNWPSSVEFLGSSSVPSSKLPASLCVQFCSEPPASHPASPHHPSRAVPPFQILPITSKTPSIKPGQHPAKGQFGLFATKDIPPRTFLLPYLGTVHLEEESHNDSEYDLRVWGEGEDGENIPLGIDATNFGNEARFCNDFRGILQRANVFFEEWSECQDSTTRSSSRPIKGLGLVSGAHLIKKGTELCVSYGKGFWEARRKKTEDQVDTSLQSPEKDDSACPSNKESSSNSSPQSSSTVIAAPTPQLDLIQARLQRHRALFGGTRS